MLRLYSFLLIAALACSCKKSSTPGNNTSNNEDTTAAITAVGTPIGNPVTKTIGAAGGTISSPDGRVDLIIPSGSLTADVPITIQPITNECPNGVGIAYDFLPSGTKFSTPATLIFHYNDDDVNGTYPYFFYLAYQDSLDEWRVNINKDVDTIGNTVTFDVPHFTGWAPGAQVKITSSRGRDLNESDQTTLQVSQGTTQSQSAGNVSDDPDELTPLPQPKPVSGNNVISWTLSAGTQNGSLSGTKGNPVTYTAPSVINAEKTVKILATVTEFIQDRNRRGKKTSNQWSKFTYPVYIHLHPTDLSFSVKTIFNTTNTSGVYNDKYHDEATFEVDVKNRLVSVPANKIQNQAPSETPSSGTGSNQRADWIPDPFGVINITGGIGYVLQDSLNFNNTDVAIILTHTNTKNPSWTITNLTNGSTSPLVGEPVPGYPGALYFLMKDSVQIMDPGKGTPLEGLMTVTVTPIH
jgi:hypothetical protein